MKILFTLFIVFTSGCVSTHVKTDKWEMNRVSLGYNATMPRLSMTPSGTIKLEGYSSEVDEEFVQAVEKALVLLGRIP